MRELMSYLPENYRNSRETVALQEALQPEADAIWTARDELLAQLDPHTATWGLSYWEDALGLPTSGHLELDLRRSQIVAKLQGRATTTPETVKTVAETLLGKPVTVTEIFNEYTVILTAETGYRPRADMDRLRKQLGEIMPAHLDWQLVIPIVVHIKICPSLGPRVAESSPPPFRGVLPPGIMRVVPHLGVNFSTITLPMAAQSKGG